MGIGIHHKLVIGLAMLAGVVFSSSVLALPIANGTMGVGEYSNSFSATWYNAHNTAGSQFPSGGQSTSVFWESDANNFWMYAAAPLTAKNLIWGTGFSGAEALMYYQHWCSPADGSNCAHHSNGFATFEAAKTNFKGMTGSEKLEIGGFTANFAGSASGSLGVAGTADEYKDSHDYATSNLGCDNVNCDASTTPMAFEFRFGITSISQSTIDSIIAYTQTQGLAFHLSPERGGPVGLPEPGTLSLLVFGLVASVWVRRRKIA